MENNGKELEKQTKTLLKSFGWKPTDEILIGSKKADLCFMEERFGKSICTAVECKDYSRKLSQKDLSSIYAEYLPLIESRKIDHILIVTREGVSPGGEEYVSDSRFLSHVTFSDLQFELINFIPYLNSLISEFDGEEISEYYIDVLAIEEGKSTSKSLKKVVRSWLNEPENQPLAVLASYGMGKTTFARYCCCQLAKQVLKNSENRIPILLRLGEISSEQSLEGLLGKLFTSTYQIHGYSFQGFLSLVRMGKFIIFLDGFDEMKHTLNWSEFKYNYLVN